MALLLDKLLLDRTDLANFREVSPNIPDEKINGFIRESQTVEVKGFLGAALYSAMELDYTVATKIFTDSTFSDLWFGTDYQLNGETVRFNGYLPAAAYFAYARLINQNQINTSRFGNESVQNEISEDISNPQIRIKGREAQQIAFAYQNDALTFLTESKAAYPLWATAEDLKPRKTSFQFFKI